MNEENIPKVAYLSKLIDYLEQSAYNLERVIEKETAGINLYAFDKGIELPEGKSQDDSFIYIIDGEVEYTIDDKLFNLKKGQTITIHAGSIHSMEVKEKAKIMVVWFKTD